MPKLASSRDWLEVMGDDATGGEVKSRGVGDSEDTV
jgi:hypothetical protein